MTSYSKYENLDNKLDTVIKTHEKILQLLEELKEEVRNNCCRCATFEKLSETSTPISSNPCATSVGATLTPISKNGKSVINSSGIPPSISKNNGSKPSVQPKERSSKTILGRSDTANIGVRNPTDESSKWEEMKTAGEVLPGTTEWDVVWGEASPTPPPITSKKPILRKPKRASLKWRTKSNNSNQPDIGKKEVPKVCDNVKSRGSSKKRRRDEVSGVKSSKQRRDVLPAGSKGVQGETAKGSLFLK